MEKLEKLQRSIRLAEREKTIHPDALSAQKRNRRINAIIGYFNRLSTNEHGNVPAKTREGLLNILDQRSIDYDNPDTFSNALKTLANLKQTTPPDASARVILRRFFPVLQRMHAARPYEESLTLGASSHIYIQLNKILEHIQETEDQPNEWHAHATDLIQRISMEHETGHRVMTWPPKKKNPLKAEQLEECLRQKRWTDILVHITALPLDQTPAQAAHILRYINEHYQEEDKNQIVPSFLWHGIFGKISSPKIDYEENTRVEQAFQVIRQALDNRGRCLINWIPDVLTAIHRRQSEQQGMRYEHLPQVKALIEEVREHPKSGRRTIEKTLKLLDEICALET